MRQIMTANVVLNFHNGDQASAAALLQNLMRVDDGMPCRYYLQYGGDWSSLKIRTVIDQFCTVRDATLVNQFPAVVVPEALRENDPNDTVHEGLHTRRSAAYKAQFLNWNLCVYKYINELDHFQIIEPDCVVLKDGWIRDITDAFRRSELPIYGHLKEGKVGGNYRPTHWAGCSYYDGLILRELPLTRYFSERYENPWWRYRNLRDTEAANNAFVGPMFSGYDATYDYFLFALYWRERTGSNDPHDWPIDAQDLDCPILCDFQSRLTASEIVDRYLDKLALFHGAKDDTVRHVAARHFGIRRALGCNAQGAGNAVKPPLDIRDLRNAFADKRCVIIGNGPSLNKTDLALLDGTWSIGTNRIYLLSGRIGADPTIYCCVNPNVIDQFGGDIAGVRSIKFLCDHRRELVGEDGKTFFIQSDPRISFVGDLAQLRWHEGWTVTYCAMQVAFYLGFSEVVLIGVDHYFPRTGEANKLVEETVADSNHFDPAYFGPGTKWQYPDLERSERSYRMARDQFEMDGRRIYDATVGGRLSVFPKVEFESILRRPPLPRRQTLAAGLRVRGRRLLRRLSEKF